MKERMESNIHECGTIYIYIYINANKHVRMRAALEGNERNKKNYGCLNDRSLYSEKVHHSATPFLFLHLLCSVDSPVPCGFAL